MKKLTVNEVSKLTGVSIRTLQYYDKIGLLKPTEYTKAGYRLSDVVIPLFTSAISPTGVPISKSLNIFLLQLLHASQKYNTDKAIQ